MAGHDPKGPKMATPLHVSLTRIHFVDAVEVGGVADPGQVEGAVVGGAPVTPLVAPVPVEPVPPVAVVPVPVEVEDVPEPVVAPEAALVPVVVVVVSVPDEEVPELPAVV
jgi:hypothetical protein